MTYWFNWSSYYKSIVHSNDNNRKWWEGSCVVRSSDFLIKIGWREKGVAIFFLVLHVLLQYTVVVLLPSSTSSSILSLCWYVVCVCIVTTPAYLFWFFAKVRSLWSSYLWAYYWWKKGSVFLQRCFKFLLWGP